MITREEIAMLLDHPVYDGDGNKIGDAKHVFFDDMTGRPEWVSVRTGMFGSSESFIP
ncbi:PRC-barrel domain-containing protein, partial [Streptomyces sp. TRM76130]|nr:PRC-barrel domain-containing protein [Streptomyces sp. TRM76130]